MTSVRCMLCFEKRVESLITEKEPGMNISEEAAIEKVTLEEGFQIRSPILGKNDIEDAQLLGVQAFEHFKIHHQQELLKIGQLAAQWNGFNLMKYFETEDSESKFEKEKERMRDSLVEEVMWGAPDDDDLDDDLEDDENEDEMFEDFPDDDDEEEEDELTANGNGTA